MLGKVPDFRFVDQSGEVFTAQRLEGNVWVANFIFTHCPSVCPFLTQKMAELQRRSAKSVFLVSFSIDPKNDTPERLRAYAEKYGADPSRWFFLTGEVEQISTTVVRGFKLSLGERVEHDGGAGYDILHATHFVLVDKKRRIRGYYRKQDEDMAKLRNDIERLAKE